MIVFADTSYFVALVSKDDEAREDAIRYTRTFAGDITTTEWVLNEFANFLARPQSRRVFGLILQSLRDDPRVAIVPATDATFEMGVGLFLDRPDKESSVADCISFLVMKSNGIRDALTKDHHFEQAGFRRLL